MANITLGGNPVITSGNLPKIGQKIPKFKLVAVDLSTKTLNDFSGNNLILNIFPSHCLRRELVLKVDGS